MTHVTNDIQECANYLLKGGLVAFPTETVYGLGANIYDTNALQKIFKYKNRPFSNPLIVHIHSFNQINELVNLTNQQIDTIKTVTDKLWPGPLTLILPKSKLINELVSGGTGYVGIRIPANEVAIEFLKKCNCPIAAPSANKYCHVSSTKESHVFDDFKSLPIKILKNSIENDNFSVGIESTIIQIDFENSNIYFLRPGFVTKNMLYSVLKYEKNLLNFSFIERYDNINTPGSNKTHYAINKETYLLETDCEISLGNDTSFIDFGSNYKDSNIKFYYTMSESANFLEAMQNIYDLLHEIEKNETKNLIIYLPRVDNQFYNSLYNRIIKCCSGNVMKKGYGIGKN